jgi:uncharacterized protein (TIGR02145 family)
MSLQKYFWFVFVCVITLSQNLFSQIVLQGVVADKESVPVQNALVELIDQADTTRIFSDYTDAQGQYVIAITGVGDAHTRPPGTFNLMQNYPNPFNPSTVIEYELAKPAHITIEIYNVLGQKIKTLFAGFQANGIGRIVWDATDDMGQGVPAGVYIYSLIQSGTRINKKMLLLDGHQNHSSFIQSHTTQIDSKSDLNKQMSNQYLLRVTGNAIETYEQRNFFIRADIVFNVTVIRTFTGTVPNASFTVTPDLGSTATIFYFDASGCSDQEDAVSALQVRWDWEYNGIWDTSFSTTKTATHQYLTTGTKMIRMEVKDTDGLTDICMRQLTVTVAGGEAGTVTDVDGNAYKTIKIGNQVWMAENLKVTHYRNGDTIPYVTVDSDWFNLSTGAYCNYNHDANNVATFGRLYNWYAVDDSRIIAPAGWHVPSDAEWQTLVDYLDGSYYAGGKLKETGVTHWQSPNYGATNESGFSALPGGYRSSIGIFKYIGEYAWFWSTSKSESGYAWPRYLHKDNIQVSRDSAGMHYGFSVRCVKDTD